jgi:cytochrome c oxidase subunit 4
LATPTQHSGSTVQKDAHAHAEHGHGHDDHGHGEAHGGHGHGIGHALPLKVLFGTWGVLMVLTVLTVAVRSIDLGANLNLTIAMLIATVKATLVCLFFMHLRYDNRFHSIVLMSAIVLGLLFVGFALMDSTQYQTDAIWAKDDLSPIPY